MPKIMMKTIMSMERIMALEKTLQNNRKIIGKFIKKYLYIYIFLQ